MRDAKVEMEINRIESANVRGGGIRKQGTNNFMFQPMSDNVSHFLGSPQIPRPADLDNPTICVQPVLRARLVPPLPGG